MIDAGHILLVYTLVASATYNMFRDQYDRYSLLSHACIWPLFYMLLVFEYVYIEIPRILKGKNK
jgi:hypothetical protein